MIASEDLFPAYEAGMKSVDVVPLKGRDAKHLHYNLSKTGGAGGFADFYPDMDVKRSPEASQSCGGGNILTCHICSKKEQKNA